MPGLRGISSPDVPAFAAKPAIEAFSYGTATPAMGELAEAALAYTHDEPHAATTQAPTTLELVADNGPADEKSTDTLAQEQLEAARAAAVMEIEEMIEQARLNGDDEGKMRLEAILNSVKGAKTISAITAAQSLTGQASGGKVETPEQRIQRMLRLEEEVDRAVEENSKYFKEEELRERDRLKALRDQYPVGSAEWINANKALISYDDEIFDRAIDRARAAGDEGAVTSLTKGQNANNEREEANAAIQRNQSQFIGQSGATMANRAVTDSADSELRANEPLPARLDIAALPASPAVLQVAHVENEVAGNLPRPRDTVPPPSEANVQTLY